MYGSAHVELGNYYIEAGQIEKAADEFNTAVRFDPSLGDGIVRMLQFRNKLSGHPQDVLEPMRNMNTVPQLQPN